MARPIEFTQEVCKKLAKKMLDYFDIEPTKTTTETFYYKNGDEKVKEIEVANELPTIKGFCKNNEITRETLIRLTKMKDEEGTRIHPELSDAYKASKEMQEDMWLQCSLKGLYPGAFTIFAGKNMFGWRDAKQVDMTTKGKAIGGFNYVTPENQITTEDDEIDIAE